MNKNNEENPDLTPLTTLFFLNMPKEQILKLIEDLDNILKDLEKSKKQNPKK